MITLKLSFSHFDELIKKGYSLDLIFLLTLINNNSYDVKSLCNSSVKMTTLYETLNRKGLITDDEKITLEGKQLLEFLLTKEDSKLQKNKPSSDSFDKWWKAYPGTDTFVHKGKTFTGSRTLRAAKEDCRIKLNKILGEGEYTIDDMVNALNYDVLQKKDKSVSTGANKLSFMQNSLTYLNQRSFEPFIELIKEGHKVAEEKSKPKGTTDI